MKRNIFFTLLLSFLCTITTAQKKEFILKNYTQEDGLPSNETYCIFEDSKHFLWIATDLGVARYDGNQFETYNLPDNVIFKIKEDKEGRIWFFSQKGLLSYFKNERIHAYKYNAAIQKRISKIHIIDAWIDSNENIHISSALDSNYIFYSNGTISTYCHLRWGRLGTNQNSKINIHITDGTNCFSEKQISSHNGGDTLYINVIRKKSVMPYVIPVRYHASAHFGAVRSKEDDVFFYMGETIYRLNKNGAFSTKQLPQYIVNIFLHAGCLWVGMRNGGAIQLNEDLSETGLARVLPDKTISSCSIDCEGGMWFSTTESGIYYTKNKNILHMPADAADAFTDRLLNIDDSILLYANRKGIFEVNKSVSAPVLLSSNLRVSDMQLMGKNKLLVFGWYGNSGGTIEKTAASTIHKCFMIPTMYEGVYLGEKNIIFSASSYTTTPLTIYEGNDFNKIWVLPDKNDHADGSPAKLLANFPTRPYLDNKKMLWLASNNGLLSSLYPYEFSSPVGTASSCFSKGVQCIRQISNGWMVASIRFGGVAVFNNPDSVALITESNGLLSNKIKYFLPLGNQLWVATAKGISVIVFSSFSPLAYKIINIGKGDGFYNLTINQLIVFKKDILAATSSGIYFIEKPGNFLARQASSIPFYFKNIVYDNRDTIGIDSIKLPYEKSRLVIKYAAVSFNSSEKIRYMYRFTNGDTAWHSTTNRERLIENLGPGTYVLQMKAVIPESDRSSEIKTFTIIIQKPWWQNNWFRLLVILMAAGLIYSAVKQRITKIQSAERKKTALNAKLAELEQTALRSQMNPHFIFNCLTSIQQLIISGQKTDANEYLVKFSRLIRKTLEMSAQPFIPVATEKAYLEEYLSLEQLRLNGQFDYVITANSSINMDDTMIPNMMLQPIVENCVRHGIKSLKGRKALITVNFSMNKKSIVCTVTDNGVGRNSIKTIGEKNISSHKSYGMDIVRKRLETFSESDTKESSIEIKDLYDPEGIPAGTEVTLQLPFKKLI